MRATWAGLLLIPPAAGCLGRAFAVHWDSPACAGGVEARWVWDDHAWLMTLKLINKLNFSALWEKSKWKGESITASGALGLETRQTWEKRSLNVTCLLSSWHTPPSGIN